MERRETSPEALERALEEQKHNEATSRILGSLGLYNAAQDEYPTIEHPEDEVWPFNHTIFPGED